VDDRLVTMSASAGPYANHLPQDLLIVECNLLLIRFMLACYAAATKVAVRLSVSPMPLAQNSAVLELWLL